MPRGGKRNNAGRKPVLDQMERWNVGSRFEELWRAEWDAAKQAAMAAATANVSVLYERANAVPIPERAAWIRLNRTYFEEFEEALAEDQGIVDGSEPSRRIQVVARRPKGKKEAIAERVAKEESVKRGIPITKRLVKACSAEFRKFEQRCKS